MDVIEFKILYLKEVEKSINEAIDDLYDSDELVELEEDNLDYKQWKSVLRNRGYI